MIALADSRGVLGWEQEERLTLDMSPQRRAEFRAGRRAARCAIDTAGLTAAPVLCGGERPLFAPHVVGTISHSRGVAIAMAGAATRYRSLGIDIEFGRIPLRAARLILDESERRSLTPHGQAWAEAILTAYFTIKEAAFKALDPILEDGAPALHGLRLRPCADGHVCWSARAPLVKCRVRTRAFTGGVLSWTAIQRSDGS